MDKYNQKVLDLFKLDKELHKNSKFFANKILKVSDPENWYQSNFIVCSIHAPEHWEDNSVRILFKSYDDFMMYHDYNSIGTGEQTFNYYKKLFYDTLPHEVSVDWLSKSGFYIF